MREEELEHFEQCAENCCRAKAEHGTAQDHGTTDYRTGDLQGSWQLAETGGRRPDSGDRRVKIPNEEEKSGESGKHRKVAKVGIPIGPLPQPSRNPSHLAHVRRRREGARRDGCEQPERESDEDKL